MNNKKIKLNWKNFLALTTAGIINAFGVTVFLYPVNLYDSAYLTITEVADVFSGVQK